MKLFKKALSLLLSVMMVATMFTFLSVTPATAAVAIPEGYEIDEQVKIDFNTTNKGWSGTNGTIGTNLTQVTDGSNKYMKLYTHNGNGYNFELADGSNSTTAYTLEGSTKYNITFKYQALNSTSGNLALFVGSKSASSASYSKYAMKSWYATNVNDGNWHTASFDFTTTDTMSYDSYNGSGNTNICNKLYLVARGYENAWAIDDVIITKYKVATPKNQITYIHFNNDNKGWSGTNGTLGTQLTQVTDPENSKNKYLELNTTTKEGYNFEIASGSNSSTAYILEPTTTYTVTFDCKLASPASGSIKLYIGGMAAYTSSYSKYELKKWTLSSNDWTTLTYTFTTNEKMTYDSYKGSGNTNLCDKLYITNPSKGQIIYIDNMLIKKHVSGATEDMYVDGIAPDTSEPEVIDTITFNTSGMGYSDYSYKHDTRAIFNHVVEDGNGYVVLGTPNSDGYNIELAKGDTNTPYIMEGLKTYTITLKFKVISCTTGTKLSINFGTQSKYSSTLSKPYMKSWKASDYNDGQWHTLSYEFTTTETMAANTYDSSAKTNICDRIYIVTHAGACELNFDEITIKKHGTGNASDDGNDDVTEPEEEEKVTYEIPDFTHEPYKTYAEPGKYSSTWYCSLRWSTATDNSNSVIRYKYAYDISENAPSTSGVRGVNAMGTNGGTPAAMCLVPVATPNTPIAIEMGKSYKISFKYKVLDIEPNSYVQFNIMRGKYSSGWTASKVVGDSGSTGSDRYIMAVEYGPNEDWVEASYTFTANYSTETDFNKLQIGGMGYGEALIDAIVVEEIDASEVTPPNNDSANYIFNVNGNTSTITSYKAKAVDLTITSQIGRRQLIEIGEYAFLYNRYTKNITIENGPTTIGKYAFEYSKVLETISIPMSITTIGDGAFYGIKTMKAFTVDANNPNFASVDGVLYTKDMKTLLYYPAGNEATAFTVPDTVTTIAEGAFLNAVNLQTITLPEGLTTIERRAFMNCAALTTVNFPTTVTSVGSSAFRNCGALIQNVFTVNESVDLGENVFADSGIFKAGDIEGNDGIDLKDATYLARHLAGWEDNKLNLISALAADINADGKVDMLDAVLFKRHLAEWNGYEALPFIGCDYESAEYTTDSTTPELVVNVSEKNSRKVTSNRDIAYDENKEDVIIILITGQSNSGTGGYKQEYEYKYTTNHGSTTHPDWEITAEPTRPEEGTVYFGATVTSLNSSNDVYFKTDTEKGASTMGGYSPAMGKALHDATGAKIVFVQASKGAVGMHEWTPEPEKYECPCSENGGGVLYSQAIANFTKTYQALEADYNIIATAYVYNQGEHEEYSPYAVSSCTIHDDQSYYDALVEMHNGFLSECEIDCGGVFLPRSWYNRYTNSGGDIEENSRRPSIARAAQYAAAQDVDRFFIFSNIAETIYKNGELKPDPTNSIHYGMAAYNAIGAQNGDSLAKYFGFTEASEFSGITVFNKIGIELCAFDANGNLVSGSDVIAFSDDNSKLYIRVNPTGSMYTVNYSSAGTTTDFVDDYGIITAVDGAETFKIVINMPVK